MINRNASRYVSIIYDEKWLLRVFFSICLRACRPLCMQIGYFKHVLLCGCITYIQLYKSRFVCAHIGQNRDIYPPSIFRLHFRLVHPLPLFRRFIVGAAHLQNFFIFLFFKSHDTINSQYSNRFIEFFHIIILWSLIF